MTEKILFITQKLKEHNWEYVDIPDPTSLTKIYDLFRGCIPPDPVGPIENLYFGAYHHIIEKNSDLSRKYELAAAERGNMTAMENLALYYDEDEHNYELSRKWHLTAIEHGSKSSYYYLARSYYDEKNYISAEPYYLKAVEIYPETQHIISELIDCLVRNGKFDEAFKICIKDLDKYGNQLSKMLSSKDCLVHFVNRLVTCEVENTKLKLENEELRFRPGGPGFEQAKSHFSSLVMNN